MSKVSIIFTHLEGSRSGQTETHMLEPGLAVLLGRDENAGVRFDPEIDDLVSRRHATITLDATGPLQIVLTDLQSSNGTYINGTRISGSNPIRPNDIVELGAGGPKLKFDSDPRLEPTRGTTRLVSAETARSRPPHAVARRSEEFQVAIRTYRYDVLTATLLLLCVVIAGGLRLLGIEDETTTAYERTRSIAGIANSTPGIAEDGKRIALIVGNSNYRHISALDNPGTDAQLIAETARRVGFDVVGGAALLDLDRPQLEAAVQSFARALQAAKSESGKSAKPVALFYYSGHGIQERGTNYLIPIDANPTKLTDFDFQMMDVNLVLHQLEQSETALNLVVLDACRNNPFGGRHLRGPASGLAEMKAPEGTLIVFATQSGNVAQDGPSGGNSPFAQALAWGMQVPNLDQFGAFNAVAVQVKRATGGSQQPWMSNSPIESRFFFVAPPPS